MQGYYFFLGYLPLPITPSALSIQTPSLNKTVNLVNEGEINIPKRGGLREISFDFLLPQINKYPFAHYQLGSYTATLWILYLKLWKETLFPFQFIVTRMSPKGEILHFTNIKCVIEEFTFDEDADSLGFDTQCSIKLKEYREYGTKSISLEEAQEKYGKTYGQGHVTGSTQGGSTQGGSKQGGSKKATVTKRRSAGGKVVNSKTTIQKGETVVTASKRETGQWATFEDITGAEVDDPEWEATLMEQPKEGVKITVVNSSTGKKMLMNPPSQSDIINKNLRAVPGIIGTGVKKLLDPKSAKLFLRVMSGL